MTTEKKHISSCMFRQAPSRFVHILSGPDFSSSGLCSVLSLYFIMCRLWFSCYGLLSIQLSSFNKSRCCYSPIRQCSNYIWKQLKFCLSVLSFWNCPRNSMKQICLGTKSWSCFCQTLAGLVTLLCIWVSLKHRFCSYSKISNKHPLRKAMQNCLSKCNMQH